MHESVLNQIPLFQIRDETHIGATPQEVYTVVSDLPRSGEWSPETVGGLWVSGAPCEVGSVFRGENLRREDVVAWAPLVRGTWFTEAEVLAADPGCSFRWAMRNKAGQAQESVWGFEMRPVNGGCMLEHNFNMGEPTDGIRKIVEDMDESEKRRFFADWTAKLRNDLALTLDRIKAVVEQETSAQEPTTPHRR